jgi:soluble lytic murein transglycosylase
LTVATTLLSVALPALAQIKVSHTPEGTLVLTSLPSARVNAAPRTSRRASPELLGTIERQAKLNRLEPALVLAVIAAESAFDPLARSVKGALGLMQLMPETARELGVADPFDPDANVAGGTRYLRRMLDRFGGDFTLALAAYNAGPSAVDRHGGVPPYPETRSYVERVLGLYRTEPGSVKVGWQGAVAVGSAVRAPVTRPVLMRTNAQGHLVLTQ